MNDIETLGVFQIFTGGGTGSAFLIDAQHLVSNCHVVAPYREVGVEMRDKRRVIGRVKRIQPKRDLAVIELAQPLPSSSGAYEAPGPQQFTVLAIEALEPLAAKQPVHILGFPVGLPLSLTEGVISHPRQLFDGQHYIQTDAAINPGNSGGPILDDERRIVGVTTCKYRSADNVGFGIPAADVSRFVGDFREQAADFGVECPSCDALIARPVRYCDSCGSDLDDLDLEAYFSPAPPHPVVQFVERALFGAGIDPVLARHGHQNWSFYSGSAPIQVWCCCSEHLCFSSPLAQPGKRQVGELFRYLLSGQHQPMSFDLSDNIVRLNLTVHMSDVFSSHDQGDLQARVAQFVAAADRYDNHLIDAFGCEPAPETQLTFLKEGAR